MKVLGPYWKAPIGVLLLDIQMIHRAQHGNRGLISLEECVSLTPSLAGKVGSLDAAGNKSLASMGILRAEGALAC